jgi:hypothetical protein
MTNKVKGLLVHCDNIWGIYDSSLCGEEIAGEALFK